MQEKVKKFVSRHLPRKVPDNVTVAIQTGVLGLLAGLSSVLFMWMVNLVYSRTFLTFAAGSIPVFLLSSLLTIVVTSALVGLLLNVFSPDAAGSGIPQVKSAYWKELGNMKLKPVLVKFLAGILSIGGGNSLGREGPSVFIGSGVAANADALFGTPLRGRRAAAVIGASAGLAAAFNAPLAAITFVIEEIVGDLNNRYLGRVVLSSVIGAFVVYALIGRQPAFSLPPIENISWLHYLLVPPVALVAALGGVVFQRTALRLRLRLKKQKRVPAWLLPVLGGKVVAKAIRVPIHNVSAIDMVVELRTAASAEAVNNMLRTAAGQAGDHLAWSDDNHASIDFNHDSHSAVIDGSHTRLLGPRLLNLLLWFDNEWGFANRMVDVTCHWQRLLGHPPGT